MKRKSGEVFLIGAGPGDPGLLTLKGKELLRRSDVVITDVLVNPRVLAWLRPGAKLIAAGRHSEMRQEAVNRAMLVWAKRGRNVARLKGGDPFLFGRGGEEAEFLGRHGIPFQVVPGVSSLTAVPAYAGIPVTDRRYNSLLTVVTGHSREDGPSAARFDWRGIPKSGTLAIFMGVKRLPLIVRKLVRAGWPQSTPVACIQWGTTPEQRTLTGRLGDILKKVERTHPRLGPPALIVIGEVARMREKIAWFSPGKKEGGSPLSGIGVAVTRPRGQAGSFEKRLRALGARVVVAPAIRIVPPRSFKAMDRAIREIDVWDWLIFTSANGAERFKDRWRKLKGRAALPPHIRTCAIGPATAEMMRRSRLPVTKVPKNYVAEEILKILPAVRGKRILIPRAAVARDVLPRVLKKRGAVVRVVEAYRTLPDRAGLSAFRKALSCGGVQCVAFTSSSTVRNLMAALTPAERRALAKEKRVAFASIGPVTSATLSEFGFPPQIAAQKPTTDHLARAVAEYFGKEKLPA